MRFKMLAAVTAAFILMFCGCGAQTMAEPTEPTESAAVSSQAESAEPAAEPVAAEASEQTVVEQQTEEPEKTEDDILNLSEEGMEYLEQLLIELHDEAFEQIKSEVPYRLLKTEEYTNEQSRNKKIRAKSLQMIILETDGSTESPEDGILTDDELYMYKVLQKERSENEFGLTKAEQEELAKWEAEFDKKMETSPLNPNSPKNIAKREAIYGTQYGNDAINKAIQEGIEFNKERLAKYDTNGDGHMSEEEIYNSWTPEEQAAWDAARAANATIVFGEVSDGLKAAQNNHTPLN